MTVTPLSGASSSGKSSLARALLAQVSTPTVMVEADAAFPAMHDDSGFSTDEVGQTSGRRGDLLARAPGRPGGRRVCPDPDPLARQKLIMARPAAHYVGEALSCGPDM